MQQLKRKFKHILLSFVFLTLMSCEGFFQMLDSTPNCIEAQDFGDIISVKLTLKVNPNEWDESKTYTPSTRFCEDAAAGTPGYQVQYYDTGVDYTSTQNPLSIAAYGYGDFCSTSFAMGYETSDSSSCSDVDCNSDPGNQCCSMSIQEDAGECTQAGILLDSAYGSTTNNLQPYFDDDELACSTEPTSNSSYEFKSTDEFLVLVPRVCIPGDDSSNPSCANNSYDYKDRYSGSQWQDCSQCTQQNLNLDSTACDECECVIRDMVCDESGGAKTDANGLCDCTGVQNCTEKYFTNIIYTADQIDFANSSFSYDTATNFVISTSRADGICSNFEFMVMESYFDLEKTNESDPTIDLPESEMKRMAISSVKLGFITDVADDVTAANYTPENSYKAIIGESKDRGTAIIGLDTNCSIGSCSLAEYSCPMDSNGNLQYDANGSPICTTSGTTTSLCVNSESGYHEDIDSCSIIRSNYTKCITNTCGFYHENLTVSGCYDYCEDNYVDLGYTDINDCFNNEKNVQTSACYNLEYLTFEDCVFNDTECSLYNAQPDGCAYRCQGKSTATGDPYYDEFYECIIGDRSHCEPEYDACLSSASNDSNAINNCQDQLNSCNANAAETCQPNCSSSYEYSTWSTEQNSCCQNAGGKTCLSDSNGNDTQYWNQQNQRVYLFDPSGKNRSEIKFYVGDTAMFLDDESLFTYLDGSSADKCECLYDANIDCDQEDVCYEISVSGIDIHQNDILYYKGAALNGWGRLEYSKPYTDNPTCSPIGLSYKSSRPFDPHWQIGWDHAYDGGDVNWQWDLGNGYDGGCWDRRRDKACLFGKCVVVYSAWDWRGAEYWYNNRQNNVGSASATIYSLDVCTGGDELVRIKIGNDAEVTLDELEIMSAARAIPNPGRVYARILDTYESELGECFVDDQVEYDFAMKNNSGSFLLTLVTVEDEISPVTILPYMMEPFDYLFNNDFRESVFYGIVGPDSFFQTTLKVVVTLYISFMGLMIVAGLSNVSQGELLSRLVRIGLIYMFVSPDGWEFFNTYIIQVFEGGAEDLAELFTYSMQPALEDQQDGLGSSFAVFDYFFYYLFQDVILTKLVAILFSPLLIGWLLFALVLGAVICVIIAIIKVMVLYVFAKVILSVLFLIGPIFFIFLVFESTKSFFMNWINMLISYSLQLALIFLVVNIFGYILISALFDVFSFGVCWGTILTITLPSMPPFEMLSFWRAAGIDPRYSTEYNAAQTISFYETAYFFALGFFFMKFSDGVTQIADKLSGDGGASTLGNLAKDITSQIAPAMKFVGKNSGKLGLRVSAFGGKIAYKTAAPITRAAISTSLKTASLGYSAAKTMGFGLRSLSSSATGATEKANKFKAKAWDNFSKTQNKAIDTAFSGVELAKAVGKTAKDTVTGKTVADSFVESRTKNLKREFGNATGFISDKETRRRIEQNRRFLSKTKEHIKNAISSGLSEAGKRSKFQEMMNKDFAGDESKVQDFIDNKYNASFGSLQKKMETKGVDNSDYTNIGKGIRGVKQYGYAGQREVTKGAAFLAKGFNKDYADKLSNYAKSLDKKAHSSEKLSEFSKYKDFEAKTKESLADKFGENSSEFKNAYKDAMSKRLGNFKTGGNAMMQYHKEMEGKKLKLMGKGGDQNKALADHSKKTKDSIYNNLLNRGIDGSQEMQDSYAKSTTETGKFKKAQFDNKLAGKDIYERQLKASKVSDYNAKSQFKSQINRENQAIADKEKDFKAQKDSQLRHIEGIEKDISNYQNVKLKTQAEQNIRNNSLKGLNQKLDLAKRDLEKTNTQIRNLEQFKRNQNLNVDDRLGLAKNIMEDFKDKSDYKYVDQDIKLTQNIVDAEIFKRQADFQELLNSDFSSIPSLDPVNMTNNPTASSGAGNDYSRFTDRGPTQVNPVSGGSDNASSSLSSKSSTIKGGKSGGPDSGDGGPDSNSGGGKVSRDIQIPKDQQDKGSDRGIGKAEQMFLDSEKKQLDSMKSSLDSENLSPQYVKDNDHQNALKEQVTSAELNLKKSQQQNQENKDLKDNLERSQEGLKQKLEQSKQKIETTENEIQRLRQELEQKQNNAKLKKDAYDRADNDLNNQKTNINNLELIKDNNSKNLDVDINKLQRGIEKEIATLEKIQVDQANLEVQSELLKEQQRNLADVQSRNQEQSNLEAKLVLEKQKQQEQISETKNNTDLNKSLKDSNLADAKLNLDTLKNDQVNLKQELKDLENENAKIAEDQALLASKKTAANFENDKLIDQESAELSRLKEQKETLSQKMADEQLELEKVRTDKASFEESIKTKDTELEQMRSSYENKSSDFEKLQEDKVAQAKDYDDKISDALAKGGDLEKTRIAKSGEKLDIDENKSKAQDLLTKEKEELKDLGEKKDSQLDELKQLEDAKSNTEEALKELKDKNQKALKEEEDRIIEEQKKLVMEELKLKSLETENQEIAKRVADRESEIAKLEEDQLTVQKQLKTDQENLKVQSELLEEQKRNLDEVQLRNQEQSDLEAKLVKDKKDEQEQISDNKDRADAQKLEKDEQLKKSSSNFENLKVQEQELITSKTKLETDRGELQKQKEELQTELDKLEAENQKALEEKTRIETDEKKLSDEERVLNDLKNNKDQLQTKIERDRESLANINLESQQSSYNEHKTELDNTIRQNQLNAEQQRKQIQQKQDDLNSRLVEDQNLLNNINSRKQENNIDHFNETQNLETLKSDKKALDAKLDGFKQEEQRINDEKSNFEKDKLLKEELDSTLTKKENAELKVQNQDLEKQQINLEKLRDERENLDNDIDINGKKLEENKRQFEELKTKEVNLNNDLKDLTKDRNEANESLNKLKQANFEKSQSEIKSIDDQKIARDSASAKLVTLNENKNTNDEKIANNQKTLDQLNRDKEAIDQNQKIIFNKQKEYFNNIEQALKEHKEQNTSIGIYDKFAKLTGTETTNFSKIESEVQKAQAQIKQIQEGDIGNVKTEMDNIKSYLDDMQKTTSSQFGDSFVSKTGNLVYSIHQGNEEFDDYLTQNNFENHFTQQELNSGNIKAFNVEKSDLIREQENIQSRIDDETNAKNDAISKLSTLESEKINNDKLRREAENESSEMLKDLESKLKDKGNEIKETSNKKKELETQNNELSQKITNDSLASFEKQADIDQKVKELNISKSTFENLKSNVESQQRGRHEELELISSNIATRESELNQNNVKLTYSQTLVDNKDREVTASEKKIESLTNDNLKLEQEAKAIDDAKLNAENEISVLKNNKSKDDEARKADEKTLQDKLDQERLELEDNKQKIDEANKDLEKLKKDEDEIIKLSKSYDEDKEKLDAERKSFEENQKNRSGKLTTLKDDYNTLETKKADTDVKITEISNDLLNKEVEISSKKIEIENLTKESNDLAENSRFYEQNLKVIEEDLESLNIKNSKNAKTRELNEKFADDRYKEQEALFNEAKNIVKDDNDKIQTFKDQITERIEDGKQDALDNTFNEIKIEDDKSALKENVTSFNKTKEEIDNNRNERNAKVRGYETEIAKADEKKNELETSFVELEKEFNNKSQEMNVQQDLVKDLEGKSNALQADLEDNEIKYQENDQLASSLQLEKDNFISENSAKETKARTELNKIADDIGEAENNLNKEKDDFNAIFEEENRLENQISKENDELIDSIEKSNDISKDQEARKAELADLDAQYDKSFETIDDASSRYNKTYDDLLNKEVEISSKKIEIENLTKESNDLAENSRFYEQNLKVIEEDLESLNIKNSKDAVTRELDEKFAQDEYDVQKAIYDQADLNLTDDNEQYNNLKFENEIIAKTVEDGTSISEGLSKQIADENIAPNEEFLKESSDELNRINTEIETLKNSIDTKQKEIEDETLNIDPSKFQHNSQASALDELSTIVDDSQKILEERQKDFNDAQKDLNEFNDIDESRQISENQRQEAARARREAALAEYNKMQAVYEQHISESNIDNFTDHSVRMDKIDAAVSERRSNFENQELNIEDINLELKIDELQNDILADNQVLDNLSQSNEKETSAKDLSNADENRRKNSEIDSKITALNSRIRELERTDPQNPEIARLKSEISGLRSQKIGNLGEA